MAFYKSLGIDRRRPVLRIPFDLHVALMDSVGTDHNFRRTCALPFNLFSNSSLLSSSVSKPSARVDATTSSSVIRYTSSWSLTVEAVSYSSIAFMSCNNSSCCVSMDVNRHSCEKRQHWYALIRIHLKPFELICWGYTIHLKPFELIRIDTITFDIMSSIYLKNALICTNTQRSKRISGSMKNSYVTGGMLIQQRRSSAFHSGPSNHSPN